MSTALSFSSDKACSPGIKKNKGYIVFEWGSKGFEFGLMWFERVLVDKNLKNLLVVVLSLIRRSCCCFVCLRM